MEVFFQELKRQLNFKRLLTYVLISIMLAGLWAWFIVGGATEDFMQTGCYKGYKGKSAIEAAAKDRNVTAGEMTEDKFQRGCDALLHSLKGDKDSDIVMSKDLLKHAVYADILVMQELRLRNMRGESTKDLLHIQKDAGKHFYENEDLYYRNYIDKNAHNQREKDLALSTWHKAKKPYIYYSGFKQWDEGIGHMMIFSFVLMVMVGIFAGSIIAKDKENGMDEIIKATTKGRKSLTAAKIVIPWIMASIIYLCGVGVYVILLNQSLPHDALNTSIQVSGKSFFPYNEGELLKKLFIFGAVGILTIASFATWISSIVKKSSRAIEFCILTILGAFLFGIFININSPVINVIKMLLPGEVVFSYLEFVELVKFPMTTILGKVFWMPSILLMVSGITFLISTVFTALNYRRR
ncbi:ABC transporter permease [Clostridium sp. P21]|uniref:ABC transporter permease n=1 Tax=Clostridium muellerianum TaxID=2716538 RepID=A0A7Y0HS76_9CLOT|nr:ABC transporter permease [Clostridium muellerianum]NMM65553.1 ABC transporter permease [Clostridium muellerianum]